jgi:hypothetical protein
VADVLLPQIALIEESMSRGGGGEYAETGAGAPVDEAAIVGAYQTKALRDVMREAGSKLDDTVKALVRAGTRSEGALDWARLCADLKLDGKQFTVLCTGIHTFAFIHSFAKYPDGNQGTSQVLVSVLQYYS